MSKKSDPTTQYLFSKNQIGVCTFIGGPFFAAYSIYKNFIVLGNKKEAVRSAWYWIGGTVAMILVSLFWNDASKMRLSFTVAYTVAAILQVQYYQESKINDLLKKGIKKATIWQCISWTILSILALLAVVAALVFVLPA